MYENEKYFEKVNNFLMDYKIDLDNRSEVRI